MQSILIYDDIYEHASELMHLLNDVIGRRSVSIDIASNKNEYTKLVNENKYSIIFLDIELDNNSIGIELGADIQKRFPDISLVYITAYIKYCEEIFRTSPDAFLLKPFTRSGVKRTIEIIKNKHRCSDQISIAASKNTIETISLESIMYIETISRCLTFFDSSANMIYKYFGIKLSQVLEKLPEHFVRCHQSICVNMRMVKSIERYRFIMQNGREIPISQSRFAETKQKYLDFLGDTL